MRDQREQPNETEAPEAPGTTSVDVSDQPIDLQYYYNIVCDGLNLEISEIQIDEHKRYTLLDRIGCGAMGTVYRAQDNTLDRILAVKVIANPVRGLDEARALARVNHPNIVPIHDVFFAPTGEPIITLDYIEGSTLRQWCAGRALTEIVRAYIAAARGLDHAHRAHVVHRDFKPDNVIVAEGDDAPRVVVIDFGLAGGDANLSSTSSSLTKIHSSGHGTRGYMPPEQYTRPADPRCDQYALCVGLWEAIADKRPFADQRTREDPLPSRPRAMPQWLHRLLARGLAYEPNDRFADMRELVTRLEQGMLWHRVSGVLFVVVPLVIVLGGALTSLVLALRPDPCDARAHELDAIWNPEVERSVRNAYRLLDTSWSERSVDYASSWLDQAVTHWPERATAVCRAQRVEPDKLQLAREAACLDEWRDLLIVVVTELKKGDLDVATNLHEVLGAATFDHSCEAPAPLLDSDVRALLTRAGIATHSRQFDEAAELLDSARERERPPCNPKRPEFTHEGAAIELQQAQLLIAGERWGEALEALERAKTEATICVYESALFEIWLYEAIALALGGSNLELAESAWANASNWLVSVEGAAGDDSIRSIELIRARGYLLSRAGDNVGARAQFEDGLRRLAELDTPTLSLWVKLNNAVAMTYFSDHDYEAAAETFADAAEHLGNYLGPSHPAADRQKTVAELNRALVALGRGEWQEAASGLARVESVSLDPGLALRVRTGLIEAHTQLGELTKATQLAEHSLSWLDEQRGLPASSQAELLVSVAGAISMQAIDESHGIDQAALERSNELLRRALGLWGNDPQNELVRFNLATNLYYLDQLSAAEEILDELRRPPRVSHDSELGRAISNLEQVIQERE